MDRYTDPFYHSKEWRLLRVEIKQRDKFRCVQCKRDFDAGKKKKIGKAECVHHIKEYKDYPELGLDGNNLISLCKHCHNKIHNRFCEKKREYINEERW